MFKTDRGSIHLRTLGHIFCPTSVLDGRYIFGSPATGTGVDCRTKEIAVAVGATTPQYPGNEHVLERATPRASGSDLKQSAAAFCSALV